MPRTEKEDMLDGLEIPEEYIKIMLWQFYALIFFLGAIGGLVVAKRCA